MTLNYEYYRIFYYVCRYGNMTKAAAALGSNQPNVTRVIRQMESELGCQLLYRTNKGISLTEEGQRLYTHVEVACEQLQAAEEELEGHRALTGGTVTVGATETALHLCLLDGLRDFHEAYPDVQLKIHNCSTPQAQARLSQGLVDLAVVTTPAPMREPVRCQELLTFQDVLVGGPQFRALSRETQTLAKMSGYPLVSLEKGTATAGFFRQRYLEQGLEFAPDIEVATADLILPMIQNGLGIGFLPEPMAAAAIASGEVYPIRLAEEIPTRQVCLFYDGKRGLSPAARKLCQYLGEQTEHVRRKP